MRSWRGSVRFSLLALVGATLARDAHAELLVVAPDDEPPAILHAELAYAQGDGEPITWLSLRVSRGPVALLAALPANARVEHGLDAWLSALEASASPYVLPPESSGACSRVEPSSSHVSWERAAGVGASELTLETSADVTAALAAEGLSVPELPPAARYVLWSWDAARAPETTRTLRLVGEAAALKPSGGALFPLLVSGFSRGPRELPGELGSAELVLTFSADRTVSSYQSSVRDWLAGRSEPLLEARFRGPVFDWSIFADTVSARPLVESYALAAARERPGLDADECARQLRALKAGDAPGAAACGDADDVSLALAATGPEPPTLERFVVSSAVGFDPTSLREGGDPMLPVVRARLLDESACVAAAPGPSVAEPPTSGARPAPPAPEAPAAPSEPAPVVVQETQTSEISCGGPAPDPTYDDRDSVDCSSDSSNDSEQDPACSSDSSSSSDDSGCGSDSSQTSDDDSGCSGSSDDGYDGDTCTGSAAPGADRAQKAQASLTLPAGASRPRRVKTSLWSLALAALALPIRRRKRGQNASG